MLDPDRYLVLTPSGHKRKHRDRTSDVRSAVADRNNRKIKITFYDRDTVYPYNHPNARLLEVTDTFSLARDAVLIIRGEYWSPPLDVSIYADVLDPSYAWVRVVRSVGGKSRAYTYPADEVAWISSAASSGSPADVRRYWRHIVELLPSDDSLRAAHEHMDFIHPDSALAAYLEASNSSTGAHPGPIILPFRSNEDQRDAVDKALRHRVSVIDGPPGTGKTETILNLIANILLVPGQTVGVVSFGNAAVDNVKDKLTESGIDFVAARVGNKERVAEFLDGQESRAKQLESWLARPVPSRAARPDSGEGSAESQVPQQPAISQQPDEDLAAEVEASQERLVDVWRKNNELARIQGELDAYDLEFRHFERRVLGEELPDMADLPLLRKHSERILDFLAETAVRPRLPDGIGGLFPRIRRYFRYGRLKDVDPSDAATVLSLERAFYTAKIAELRQREHELVASLEGMDAEEIRLHHERLSRDLLERALRQRYADRSKIRFDDRSNSISRRTFEFLSQYPVVLTTCHSIRWNLAEGTLLDWLVIDEATQTGLLTAALAMSRARNVVVVGDLKQLGHFLGDEFSGMLPRPPVPAYDVEEHSILSSVGAVYADDLPRTMLREHFRCARPIIEFCNQMYYGGALIPCRPGGKAGDPPPLMVIKTAPGNHARKVSRGSERGTYNQREIDEIIDNVLVNAGILGDRRSREANGDFELGVTTPYRLQANRLSEALGGIPDLEGQRHWLAKTVHKFQGRGAKAMVLSTVVDESRKGQLGLRFADDPRLINVAVSRAKDRFILVTNHDGVPRSTHIKALVDYIRFHDPDQIVEGRVVSVFDLLYKDYSERLEHFARQVHGQSEYASENIIWTLVRGILAEGRYELLDAAQQVRLRDLLPDTRRLNPRQKEFVRSVSAVDIAVYHRVTRRLKLAIEVNGTAFHEENPVQQERDRIKAGILQAYGVDVVQLRTNASGEERIIRGRLDDILERG